MFTLKSLVYTTALIFAVSTFAGAKDIFVAQNSMGADDGLASSSSHGIAWLNSEANWGTGSSQIAPGDSVRLCGNITSTIIVQGNGIADKPITIFFEPGAKLTNEAWSNSGAIFLMLKSYITIDGGATGTIGGDSGDPSLSNGIIENTANGNLLQNQVNSFGIKAQECKHLTIKNLVIQNLYVRSPGNDLKDYGTAISCKNTNGNGVSNFLVTNCIIHDAYIGIESDFGPGDHDYEYSYNTIYNCNWGGVCGARVASSTLDGLLVHHNRFYDWKNWNETSVNAFHHNGFFAFANVGLLRNPVVHSNKIGPGYGNDYQTSGIYLLGNVTEPLLYNNLFIANPGEYAANGLITTSSTLETTFNIFNNTFSGGGSGGAAIQLSGTQSIPQTITIKNNLAIGNGGGTFIAVYNNKNINLIADYNNASGMGADTAFIYSENSNGAFKTTQQWRALGFDLNGSSIAPVFVKPGNDFHLAPSDKAGAAKGQNLSLIFKVDKEKKLRPESSAWDIGAYESVPPKAPSNIRIK